MYQDIVAPGVTELACIVETPATHGDAGNVLLTFGRVSALAVAAVRPLSQVTEFMVVNADAYRVVAELTPKTVVERPVNGEPPVSVVYQRTPVAPALGVADKVALELLQTKGWVTEVIEGVVMTKALTAVRLALVPKQFEASA